MVRWASIDSRFVVVDRPGPQVTVGHSEALLDLPQLVVGAEHIVRGRGVVQVGDVALQTREGSGLFGLQVPVDRRSLENPGSRNPSPVSVSNHNVVTSYRHNDTSPLAAAWVKHAVAT